MLIGLDCSILCGRRKIKPRRSENVGGINIIKFRTY